MSFLNTTGSRFAAWKEKKTSGYILTLVSGKRKTQAGGGGVGRGEGSCGDRFMESADVSRKCATGGWFAGAAL